MPQPADAVFAAFMVLVGLAVGSFLNVAADRLPKRLSILSPPSHCPGCQRRIPAYDLVPVFSYVLLRGRCRYCQASIPARVPLVEGGTGLLFGWIALRYGVSAETAMAAVTTSVMVLIILVDLEHKLILNGVIALAVPVVFALFPLGPHGAGHPLLAAYGWALAGAGLGFGVLLAIFLLTGGRGIGAGDVKLGALLGAAVGFPGVVAVLEISFVVGGVVALTLLVSRRFSRRDALPFGPFLAGAAIAVLLTGDFLYAWYLALLTA